MRRHLCVCILCKHLLSTAGFNQTSLLVNFLMCLLKILYFYGVVDSSYFYIMGITSMNCYLGVLASEG